MKNKKDENIPVGRLKQAADFLPPLNELVQPEENVNVTIDIIRDSKIFMEMRDEWNAVLAKSGINNPFLSHEWLSAWWTGYGKDKELFIVGFKSEGRFVGFVPLMKYKTKLTGFPVKVIGFLSNHWTRMDFILSDQRRECLNLLCDIFKESGEVIILAQMDTQGKNYSEFQTVLRDKNLSLHEEPKPHAYLMLEGSWKDFFSRQSRNFRMDSRRKLNRLEKEGKVSFARDSKGQGSTLEKIISIAQESWQSQEQVNIVCSNEGKEFYAEIMKAWQTQNKMDFSILCLNDKPVSYMIGVRNNDSYFAFDTAYDKTYHQFSPGLILHNLLLEQLYQEGIHCLDFGYTAQYKKRWSEQIVNMMDVIIYPSNIKGRLLNWGRGMKRILKRKEKND